MLLFKIWKVCDCGILIKLSLLCTLPIVLFYSRSQSHVTTHGQSVSMSRDRAHSGTCDQILLSVRWLFSESCCLVSVGCPLCREDGSAVCSVFTLEVEVEITLRLTVSQSVSQSVGMSRYRAHSGTCDQMLLSVRRLFSESCCFVSVGRPLCREDGSAVCSVFTLEVEVEVTLRLTVSQSVSMSRYGAHSGTCDQMLLSVRRLFSESCRLVSVGRPLWREVASVTCPSQSVIIYQYLHQAFTLHVFYSSAMYTQYIRSFFQSRLGRADYALLVTTTSNYHSSLDIWTVV
jgi:hypothetical protein